MKIYKVEIEGTVPLLQNRYVFKDEQEPKIKRKSGEQDYSQEWKEKLYYDKKIGIYQPAIHIENAMIRSSSNFQIVGKKGKTYKEIFKAAVFVKPDFIPLNKKEPDYIDKRLVRINRAGVEKRRPAFKEGWKLKFDIEVLEDQISKEVVKEILDFAGKFAGIGDYRPRFGRFMVTKFE